ncbi:MAG: hypothetical protein BJ554DRAFT_6850 [Olpidium bornovanus]|uniref:Uncharacterized protein n=1 Tax=Olpidium bornovanus TaxID=278681 RepID=A0A8H7ZX68_9FUNG|nr:MAG: hypothetical protein BJ554DRAFT_6850 [Olpidium bornovanus]
MIQAYALISEGVRIRCTHQQGKGEAVWVSRCRPRRTLWVYGAFITYLLLSARQVFLSTPGSKSLRENISNVFGAKALLAIMPFDIVLIPEKENDDDELRRYYPGFAGGERVRACPFL